MTHTDLQGLLACPFCGATPHRGLGKVRNCQIHGDPFQDFSIWCPRGHAKITTPTEDMARAAWNQRASLTAKDAEREQIERDHYETSMQWRSQFDAMYHRAMQAEKQLTAKDAEIAALRVALANIFNKLDRGEGAPGHLHDVAGIWDADNAPGVAGTKCEWCAQWDAARALHENPESKA